MEAARLKAEGTCGHAQQLLFHAGSEGDQPSRVALVLGGSVGHPRHLGAAVLVSVAGLGLG